jgi:hypothetical protein
MFFPQEDGKADLFHKVKNLLLYEESVRTKSLCLTSQVFPPGVGFSKDITDNQKSACMTDSRKFAKCSFPVIESGQYTFAEEGIKGSLLKGKDFSPSLEQTSRCEPMGRLAEEGFRIIDSD